MSAYNIELPGVVLAGLYKKAIVQGEGKAVVGVAPLPPGEDRVEAPAQAAGTRAAEAVALAAVNERAAEVSTTAAGSVRPTEAVKTAAGEANTITDGERSAAAAVGSRLSTQAVVPASGNMGGTTDAGQTGSGAAAPLTTMGSTAGFDVPPVSATVRAAQQLQPDASSVYKILGNNRQQVTVIVRSPGEAFLPENHLQFLTKMLGACKLNLGDVAIVNDANLRVDMNLLKSQLQPKTALLFGVTPEEAGLPLSFPAFKAQEYAGTTYLLTPSLEELNMDTEDGKLLKRRLWDSLRKIFGV